MIPSIYYKLSIYHRTTSDSYNIEINMIYNYDMNQTESVIKLCVVSLSYNLDYVQTNTFITNYDHYAQLPEPLYSKINANIALMKNFHKNN